MDLKQARNKFRRRAIKDCQPRLAASLVIKEWYEHGVYGSEAEQSWDQILSDHGLSDGAIEVGFMV